jgi:hypothetical protein
MYFDFNTDKQKVKPVRCLKIARIQIRKNIGYFFFSFKNK